MGCSDSGTRSSGLIPGSEAELELEIDIDIFGLKSAMEGLLRAYHEKAADEESKYDADLIENYNNAAKGYRQELDSYIDQRCKALIQKNSVALAQEMAKALRAHTGTYV